MTAPHDELPRPLADDHREPSAADRWRWQLVGEDGLLVDLPDGEAVARVSAALRASPPEGVADVVPAARTVLVRGSARGRSRWADAVERVAEGSSGAASTNPAPTVRDAARAVEIPVVYDGEDLAEVAALAGLMPDEVAARHAAGRYRVAFGGFMPGFAYLTGLDPALVVPRLATPRTRVPAGAVAIAGEYAAVYPRATPGGWRLLGRTAVVMFDPAHDERPALLAPGDEVRFVPTRDRLIVGPPNPRERGTSTPEVHMQVPHSLGGAPRATEEASTEAEVSAGGVEVVAEGCAPSAGVEVLATGPLVLVEDAGRPGHAAVGVPRSGVADPAALRAANRLVGNRADAAVLEVVLGGLVVRFGATTAIALVGAPAPAELDDRRMPYGQAVRAPAGSTLELGVPASGLRTWLAVRGGVDVPAVLGSRSTDVLSGLGPPPVAAGDMLPIGHEFDGLPEVPPVSSQESAASSGPGASDAAVGDGDGARTASNRWVGGADGPTDEGVETEAEDAEAEDAEVVVLPATAGPRIDRLADESRRRLVGQVWTVTPDSNRVALRLDGEPLATGGDGELPSEGLVLGAVQLPHDGRPVVFGPDHPVTGGYPVVAVLTFEGIARAAQCRPGDLVRFVVQ